MNLEVSFAVNAHGGSHGRLDAESETLVAAGAVAYPMDNGQGEPNMGRAGDPAFALHAVNTAAVAFGWNKSAAQTLRVDQTTDALQRSETSNPAVAAGMAVRRLTPRECERLQGFPDDYAAINYKGKPAADGPRYRALGNSMAVVVVRWIGERIQMCEDVA